ncbi:unnamed protein product [Rotaria socialis]|uniref:Uncharacterized protein n=1 Tax=Rotaria socialis TaxID=392032 RepID=A0A818EGL0_9BILA|nr:unnamed protein product [Rotaria socialis]CAF4657301.1 unnamed protein product [Rotaria socialis]
MSDIDLEVQNFMNNTTSTQHDSVQLSEVAINQLMEIVGPDDVQGKLVVKLLAEASQYASSTMSEKIKSRVRAIKLAQKLFQEIREELAQYKELNVELAALTTNFISYVRDLQLEANKALGVLDLERGQLEIIIDELTDDGRPLSYSTQEINGCVDNIFQIIRPATASCGEINKKLTELETKLQQFQSEKVEPAKEDAIKREKNARMIKRGLIATGAGAVAGGAAVGIVVAAPILGGVGSLVLAGFPPVGVILITIAGGAVIIGGIGFLVARLIRNYGEYRTRAVQYLEWLSKLCTDLQKDIEKTKLVAHNANQCSDSLQNQLAAIKISLGSEKQRKKNVAICLKAKNSIEEVYCSLQEIMKIDLTQWTATRQLPSANLASVPYSSRR